MPLTAPPQPSSPTRARRARLAGPLLTGGVVLAGTIALRLRDPHVPGSWGYCPVALLTGFDCPGCGALRAVNHLTHGDVVAAASSNLVLVLAVPALVVGWLLWLRGAARDREAAPGPPRNTPRGLSPTVIWTATGLAVLAFAVLRNLPVGAWLHS